VFGFPRKVVLEQHQQFGIFYFPNLEVWQLSKRYGKEKKG
jgi:hypothetical protein